MTVLLYPRNEPHIRSNFVCFSCRVRVRHNKYDWQNPQVFCPECGCPCDALGDRCTTPPKNKIKEWQALAQDYRALQRRIVETYVLWKQRVVSDIQRHLILAESLGLSEIAEDDRIWLQIMAELDELPSVYQRPFSNDFGKRINRKATYSDIDDNHPESAVNVRLNELQSQPFNKERQKIIDDLIYKKNSLHIYDMFWQIYEQIFSYHTRRHNRFADEKCLKNLITGS